MKKIFLALTMLLSFTIAETEFATPKPSIDNPRQLIFSLHSADPKEINHTISSINNIMKFYRPENTEVVIVVYAQGLKYLLKKGDVAVRKRIEALMTYDVEFIACRNTMRTLNIEEKDLLDNIEYATAGIVEIIERELRGYSYIQP